jgi:hypothetical protein
MPKKEDDDIKQMYCGIGDVPKNKVRGTPEYCVRNNQVRYYGVEALSEDMLNLRKSLAVNLEKEQLKLRKLLDQGTILLRQIKNEQFIYRDERQKESARKRADKKLDQLLAKRDKLVKKIKDQRAYVVMLEEEQRKQRAKEAAEKKKAEKAKKKSSSKSKSSGSKSSGSKKSSSKKSGSKSKSSSSGTSKSSSSKKSGSKSSNSKKSSSKSSGSKSKLRTGRNVRNGRRINRRMF